MAVERPTFHESWYRVADLHPRLRSTVQVSRQHFRGMPWYVVQDHTNNAFFRLAEPAYRFIGLLDGKRTVGECWKIVNEQKGDDAPTQGEVIQLLGQLYMANLLQAEVPADTYTLFARYKKRKQREIASYMMNIMFARLPLFDPDAFLNRWLKVLGWIFSPVGLVVWLILIGWGVYSIAQRPGWQTDMARGQAGLLSPDNLILLYIGFAMIKACHEMGHAISCKKFGRQSGTGGEVHVIGIMFLVFTPVPYVDASSSWALKNKWHRAIVGAAGMWVELAIASVAAVVWANTSDGSWHAFAYNVMFVASFSTIVFNGNPLLRYDGYYILSDLLEIPNLGQRSKDYVYHLVKRYIWNVRFSRSPAQGVGEQIWLFIYAIASFLMRTFVSLSIMFYLTTVLEGALIIVAFAMAVAGLFTWLAMPVGKFAHYLVTSQELTRVRPRAIVTTLAAAAALVVGLGVIRAPDRSRAQGLVVPSEMSYLIPGAGEVQGAGGFVTDLRVDPTRLPQVVEGQLLATTENQALEADLKAREAEVEQLQIEFNAQEPAKRGEVQARLTAQQRERDSVKKQVQQLALRSPGTGTLVSPLLDIRRYGYLRPGEQIGVVANLKDLTVMAVVPTDVGGQLQKEKGKGAKFRVEMRIDGQPEFLLSGQASLQEAGLNELPSPSLALQAGGEFAIAPDDRSGTHTQEKFFMVRIDQLHLDQAPKVWRAHPEQLPLLAGQRVVVRFEFGSKPVVVQAWKKLLQVFQRRFQV